MGNLCGRASKDEPDDAFAQPGRTLGSAPPPSSNPRAAVPKIASTGGGRTLGSSSSGQGEGDIDARQAAAKAAEVFYLSLFSLALSIPPPLPHFPSTALAVPTFLPSPTSNNHPFKLIRTSFPLLPHLANIPSLHAIRTPQALTPQKKKKQDRAAKASQQPKGKLGRDLAKEKAQTRNGALSSVSRDERRRRDADEGAEARNWN